MGVYYLVEFGPVQGTIAASRKLSDAHQASRLFQDELLQKMKKLFGRRVLLPAKGSSNVFLIEDDGNTEQDLRCVKLPGVRLRARWVQVEAEDPLRAYKEASRLLAGRSAIREFGQPEGKGICTMCGGAPAARWSGEGLAQGEKLCEECYRRRVDGMDTRFPSTTEIASWSLKLSLEPDQLREYSERLRGAFDSDRARRPHRGLPEPLRGREEPKGEFLFLPSDRELREMGLGERGTRERVRRKIQELKGNLKIPEPSPYLFVARFDGDSMGKRLSGCESFEALIELSAKIGDFADKARQLQKKMAVLVIYSAGDDLLVLGSPICWLELLKEVREMWNDTVKGGLSGALGLFHHKHSLRDALIRTERWVEEAKEDEKNSLVLGYVPRGGQEAKVKLRNWGDALGSINSVWDALLAEEMPGRLVGLVEAYGNLLGDGTEPFRVMLKYLFRERGLPPEGVLAQSPALLRVLRGFVREVKQWTARCSTR